MEAQCTHTNKYSYNNKKKKKYREKWKPSSEKQNGKIKESERKTL